MKVKLFFEAIIKYLLGLLIVSVLLFIPAGTINYVNGWIFIGVLFIPVFIAGIIMMIKSPNLLQSRLNVNEKEKEQKEVVMLSGIMFIFGFIVAGLNYRYNWIKLPNIVVFISIVIFLISYILYAEVLRENAFLSRTIEVGNNQKIVQTGLYKIVRHPMYSVTLILFLSMPLILGSIFSFIIFLVYPFILIKRIKNEEQVLEKNLKEYSNYKKKVRYRLIPFVW